MQPQGRQAGRAEPHRCRARGAARRGVRSGRLERGIQSQQVDAFRDLAGGTEPTVTDANLVLGYLDPELPLAGGVDLDREAAERAVGTLAAALWDLENDTTVTKAQAESWANSVTWDEMGSGQEETESDPSRALDVLLQHRSFITNPNTLALLAS